MSSKRARRVVTAAQRAAWAAKKVDRVCGIEGCEARHYAKGYCEDHWREQRNAIVGKYGMPPEEIERLPKRCAICESTKQLVIDHDHKSGVVRGRLCHHCNVGIGWLGDSPQRLRDAAKYLENPPAQRGSARGIYPRKGATA
jgi:hypothetical protein